MHLYRYTSVLKTPAPGPRVPHPDHAVLPARHEAPGVRPAAAAVRVRPAAAPPGGVEPGQRRHVSDVHVLDAPRHSAAARVPQQDVAAAVAWKRVR